MLEKNTLRNYEFILANFQNHFGDIELSTVTSEDILAFMSTITDGTKQNSKKLRFTLLSAFFNFVNNSVDPEVQNPCDNPALRKLFRAGKPTQFKILEKDVVDEIIFRTRNQRNRLMLELMARSGICQRTRWGNSTILVTSLDKLDCPIISVIVMPSQQIELSLDGINIKSGRTGDDPNHILDEQFGLVTFKSLGGQSVSQFRLDIFHCYDLPANLRIEMVSMIFRSCEYSSFG